MTIRRGNTIGVCMGVRRALDLVEKIRKENPELPLATIGPIIHNPRVLDRLAREGVGVVESPEEIGPGGGVIVRAHGLSPDKKAAFASRGLLLFDGTCPRVLKSQELADTKSREGWHILIAGDSGHGEVRGIAGYTATCEIISNGEEAKKCQLSGKNFVIGQTTIRQEEYDEICGILKRRAASSGSLIKIAQTICPATRVRQEAVRELAEETDAVLVIGGKGSANTSHLYHTAREMGKPVWHIEGAADIPEEIYQYNVVGLSAGASTPEWIIREVEEALELRSKL